MTTTTPSFHRSQWPPVIGSQECNTQSGSQLWEGNVIRELTGNIRGGNGNGKDNESSKRLIFCLFLRVLVEASRGYIGDGVVYVAHIDPFDGRNYERLSISLAIYGLQMENKAHVGKDTEQTMATSLPICTCNYFYCLFWYRLVSLCAWNQCVRLNTALEYSGFFGWVYLALSYSWTWQTLW